MIIWLLKKKNLNEESIQNFKDQDYTKIGRSLLSSLT